MANVKFIQEKRLISKYFEEISLDTGKYCFGVDDTLACLDMGACETLIVWENLEVSRASLFCRAASLFSPRPMCACSILA